MLRIWVMALFWAIAQCTAIPKPLSLIPTTSATWMSNFTKLSNTSLRQVKRILNRSDDDSPSSDSNISGTAIPIVPTISSSSIFLEQVSIFGWWTLGVLYHLRTSLPASAICEEISTSRLACMAVKPLHIVNLIASIG